MVKKTLIRTFILFLQKGIFVLWGLIAFPLSSWADETSSTAFSHNSIFKLDGNPGGSRSGSSDFVHTNSIFNLEPKNKNTTVTRLKTYSGLYASLGLFGLNSTAQSQNESVAQNRHLYAWGADAVLGYRIGLLIFGVGGSYSLWRQETDPKDIRSSNVQGVQNQGGIVVGIDFSYGELLGRYNIHSYFAAENKNIAGQDIAYSAGTSYDIQARLNLSRLIYLGIDYNYSLYKKYSANGRIRSLSSDDEMTFQGVGVALGIKY